MRSFALWYCNKKGSEQPDKEVTVHINLWDKQEDSHKKYCFDFGILVENLKGIESIYLYVPFVVKKENVKDLGSVISNNQLVNAIFNEDFTTTEGEPKRLIVNGANQKEKFVIYSLEIESQVDFNNCKRSVPTPGTILEIKVGSIEPNNIYRYYFRVRIDVDCSQVYLINDEIKGKSIFSNKFTNTEVIDFRLNDIRSCSEELREQFDKGKKFRIKVIHYLILRNANDEIIHYGKPITSRMLENDLWKTYIEGKNHNIIAYHIKSKAEKVYNHETKSFEIDNYINDFSDLTRFQYQKGNWTVLIKYIIGIVGLGAIGGVIGNLISSLIGL